VWVTGALRLLVNESIRSSIGVPLSFRDPAMLAALTTSETNDSPSSAKLWLLKSVVVS
jgi:hypothetical protein